MMLIQTILALFLATFYLAVPVAQALPLPAVPGAAAAPAVVGSLGFPLGAVTATKSASMNSGNLVLGGLEKEIRECNEGKE